MWHRPVTGSGLAQKTREVAGCSRPMHGLTEEDEVLATTALSQLKPEQLPLQKHLELCQRKHIFPFVTTVYIKLARKQYHNFNPISLTHHLPGLNSLFLAFVHKFRSQIQEQTTASPKSPRPVPNL